MRAIEFTYVDGVAHRICTKCKELKPLEKFVPRRNRASGTSSACKACIYKQSVEYQRANPDKAYKYTKQWRQKNQERHKANIAKHKATDKAKQTTRAWIERNRERINLKNRARNVMRRGMRKSVTKKRILELLSLQRGRCAVCKCDCRDNYHVDHIYPISKGGDSSAENLQILCATCNISKGAKEPTDFMRSRGFLL